MADREWLTVPQVAAELQVTVDTVRRWIRGKELPAAYLGSTKAGYRVSRADLNAFLQRHYGRSAKEPAPGNEMAAA